MDDTSYCRMLTFTSDIFPQLKSLFSTVGRATHSVFEAIRFWNDAFEFAGSLRSKNSPTHDLFAGAFENTLFRYANAYLRQPIVRGMFLGVSALQSRVTDLIANGTLPCEDFIRETIDDPIVSCEILSSLLTGVMFTNNLV